MVKIEIEPKSDAYLGSMDQDGVTRKILNFWEYDRNPGS